jgi:hypothetical protein
MDSQLAPGLLRGMQEVNTKAVLPNEVLSCCCTFVAPELKLMLSFLRNGVGLLLFPLLLSVSAPRVFAQVIYSDVAPVTASKFKVSIGTGYGRFSDIMIQDPGSSVFASEDVQPRPDSSVQTGMPMFLGMAYARDIGVMPSDVKFDFLNVSNHGSVQGAAARNSSLSRYDLSIGTNYHTLSWTSGSLYALSRLQLRRNTYTNNAKSHMLDSLIPRLGMGINLLKDMSASAYVGAAVYNRVGYSQGRGLGSRPVKGSSSSLREYGLDLDYRVSPTATVNLGVQSEQAVVKVADLRTYNQYGYNISSFTAQPSRYQLTTNTLKIGIVKSW